MKEFIGVTLVTIIVFFVFFSADLFSWIEFVKQYQSLQLLVDQDRMMYLVLFGLLYWTSVAFSLPIALLLTLGGAALFGWPGFLSIWIGATFGALTCFVGIRYFFADWARRRLGRRLANLAFSFQESPLRWSLSLRLMPVMPFWMATAIPALLGMNLWAFLASTAVGILPGTLIYMSLGVGFRKVFGQGEVPNLALATSKELMLPLVFLSLFTAASAWRAATRKLPLR